MEWLGNIDWIQVAGFMITLVLFVGLVFGGWAYYNSERAKVHTAESDDLVKTRGQKIDDLKKEIADIKAKGESEIADLREIIQNQQGQIDMLRKLKTQEIIDGVVAGGIPAVIKGVVEGLKREGIG